MTIHWIHHALFHVSHAEMGDYDPFCALFYLDMNPDAGAPWKMNFLKINNLRDLSDALTKHKFLYNGIFAAESLQSELILNNFTTGEANRYVIVTGLGYFSSPEECGARFIQTLHKRAHLSVWYPVLLYRMSTDWNCLRPKFFASPSRLCFGRD